MYVINGIINHINNKPQRWWNTNWGSPHFPCDEGAKVMTIAHSTTGFSVSDTPVVIYGFFDEPNGMCRYVGKTKRKLVLRVASHINAAKKGSLLLIGQWIREKLAQNETPVFAVLEEVAPGEDWQARERFWIAHFRALNVPLLNMTNGGAGAGGFKQSKEHKEKIARARRRGAFFACGICKKPFWRKPSEIKQGHNLFCSIKCRNISLKGQSHPISRDIQIKGRAANLEKMKSKNSCHNGHEYNAQNTRINKAGSRVCKICFQAYRRVWRAQRKKQYKIPIQLTLF
jgi:hypothetical protein